MTEPAEDCAAARAITVQKEARRLHIASLLAAGGAADADTLASQIALLIEGAVASMLVRNDPAVAVQARDAEAILMRAAGTLQA